jgi:protein-S-isoprenylcysteine O-methyltransferase Ste14
MLWVRGAIFTVLAPGLVGIGVPSWIDPARRLREGAWQLGWLPAAAGGVIYLLCLARFLAAGGTPAIFFTRPLRALIGEEPDAVIRGGLYARSRNPMYLGVLLIVAGQAVLFASRPIAAYAALLALGFHLIVVLVEEPHLRRKGGEAYEAYARRVPRWLA